MQKKSEDSLMKLEGNLRLNKIKKLNMKKKKKQMARNGKFSLSCHIRDNTNKFLYFTERAAEKLADTIANVQL